MIFKAIKGKSHVGIRNKYSVLKASRRRLLGNNPAPVFSRELTFCFVALGTSVLTLHYTTYFIKTGLLISKSPNNESLLRYH